MADKKLDLKSLREKNEPLARVVEVMAMGKTARDEPEEIAADVALALEARDPKSALARALDEYEKAGKNEIATHQGRVLKELKAP